MFLLYYILIYNSITNQIQKKEAKNDIVTFRNKIEIFSTRQSGFCNFVVTVCLFSHKTKEMSIDQTKYQMLQICNFLKSLYILFLLLYY